MTKKELVLTRAASVLDKKLSHGAARLFALLVETHYLSCESADHEFECVASWIQKRLACGHNQARGYVAELVDRFYIVARGKHGCPPTPVFSFSQVTRNRDDESPETGTMSHPKQVIHVTRNGDDVTKRESTEIQKRGDRRAVTPAKPAPEFPWWQTPPQFEKLDRKCFPRERRVVGKDMIDYIDGKTEQIETKLYSVRNDADATKRATATHAAFKKRRAEVRAWMNGVAA